MSIQEYTEMEPSEEAVEGTKELSFEAVTDEIAQLMNDQRGGRVTEQEYVEDLKMLSDQLAAALKRREEDRRRMRGEEMQEAA
ncbi:MAG TPA: hypothetical protein VJB41_03215 [Patescibacteria group bacterium]|nr:hypothetical protein [Patescibacteria group bacterium]